MRIGQGFDVHPFEAGRRLVLGGVVFDGETGLSGHSDGDVLTHAVIDALLGAAALGDLGAHFPSAGDRWRGADSIEMLGAVVAKVAAAGFAVSNVDVTVIAERPRIAPVTARIRGRLAEALGLPVERVSVKATTTDGLGGEGIGAMAVALLDEAASR
jgi:2-C-methyl-D-erythritol 2,4-cyclodiphosphate synthase